MRVETDFYNWEMHVRENTYRQKPPVGAFHGAAQPRLGSAGRSQRGGDIGRDGDHVIRGKFSATINARCSSATVLAMLS